MTDESCGFGAQVAEPRKRKGKEGVAEMELNFVFLA
jgi:hypothetical protein